jgi:putative ABC transport system permease protein
MVLGGVGALAGSTIALAVSAFLLVVPIDMPPPPGRSVGYPLNITVDLVMYLVTILVMVLLTMAASAWVARKTVNMAVVDALAHT